MLGTADHYFSLDDVTEVFKVALHQKILALWLFFGRIFVLGIEFLVDVTKVSHVNALSMQSISHTLRVRGYTVTGFQV